MATKKTAKKGRRKKQRPNYSKIVLIVVICFFAGAFTYAMLDYFFSPKKDIPIQPKIEKPKIDIEKYKRHKLQKQDYNDTFFQKDKNLTDILDKNISKISLENNTTQDQNLSPPPAKKISAKDKPKLAIIIDDVSTNAQAMGIKNTGIIITPSIFPPTSTYPNTPLISKKFAKFMIHLPTEAIRYTKAEENTLTTKSSYEEIENRIKIIRKNFPQAVYLNNHTGSKFTSDKNSMDMLIKALKKYDFKFIDSKTINKSKGKWATKRHGMRYVYRDVFLDNTENKDEIRKMLKQAVKIAKKRGYAIAIGHPKSVTLQVLKTSEDIFKDVKLVYVDEIYDYYK